MATKHLTATPVATGPEPFSPALETLFERALRALLQDLPRDELIAIRDELARATID